MIKKMACGLFLTLFAGTAFSATNGSAEKAKGDESRFLENPRQVIFAGNRSGEGYFGPNGRYMVFQAEREKGNPFYQIYLRDMKTGETQLVSPGNGKTTCAWIHPKQQRVLFASTHHDKEALNKQKEELEFRASGKKRRYSWDYDENYDLFSIDFDGRGLRQLTKTKGYDAEGSYSPDGEWVVFASNRAGYSEKLSEADKKRFEQDPSYMMDLYIMRTNGKDLKRLTQAKGYDGGPFFSPDGKRIVWRRFSADGHKSEVFVMDVDGSNKTQLTNAGKISWAPFFHPSGDYLIYASNMSGGHNFDLYLIRSDEPSEPVRVTYDKSFDGLPVFTPDGKQLSWTASRTSDGKAQIFMAEWNDQVARKALGLSAAQPLLKAFDPHITTDDLKKHVTWLASEKLEGRLTGSPGEKLATQYAADYFNHIGLEPAAKDGTYFDPFEFSAMVELGDLNELILKNEEKGWSEKLQLSSDWLPLVFSGNGPLSGEGVVFAGYGIEAPEGQGFSSFNSYEGLEVRDKWVMVFRYMPEDLKDDHRQYLSRFSKLNHKAMVARDRGARGLIIVSGPNSKVKHDLIPLEKRNVSGSISLPVISVSDKVAEHLLSKVGKNLAAYQKSLDKGEVNHLDLGSIKMSGYIDLQRKKKTARNVLARLKRGQKPRRRVVVIGAHMDHLGHGQAGNSLAKGKEKGQIHPGADDNASGVAAVMEVAHQLSSLKNQGKWKGRTDVIIALWSGEELGTLGSTHFIEKYVKGPSGENQMDVIAYINLDMVGRYENVLNLQALGSSSDWMQEVEKARVGLKINLNAQQNPYLPTDSTPFYLAKVPVLTAFTGVHEEYHSPRDTAERVNFEGLQKVARLVGSMTYALAARKQPLTYVEVPRENKAPARHQMRIYLGTIPDYSKVDAKGVALMGVQEGGPAAKAGMQPGDIIIQLGGRKIENLYDYTAALGYLKAGEKTKVIVQRKKKKMDIEVVPESRD